jgi:amino acid permease
MVLPKNFENGGWVVGVLAINVGCVLVSICAQKLVKCAIKIDCYDYREVVR